MNQHRLRFKEKYTIIYKTIVNSDGKSCCQVFTLAGFPIFPAIWVLKRGNIQVLKETQKTKHFQERKLRKFDPNGFTEVDSNASLSPYVLYPDQHNVRNCIVLFDTSCDEMFRKRNWIVCVKLQ